MEIIYWINQATNNFAFVNQKGFWVLMFGLFAMIYIGAKAGKNKSLQEQLNPSINLNTK